MRNIFVVLGAALSISGGLCFDYDYLEFPEWLVEITHMEDWPDYNVQPPYFPLENVDLSTIPDIPIRQPGQCDIGDVQACAFDCGKLCGSDVMSCEFLSQTFDDGPTEATESLLDHLYSRGVKSTFFLIGQNVIDFPDIVEKEYRQGHLIGTHTWSHMFLPALSNEEVIAQIQWGLWAVNATIGVVPRFFRPPYGGIDTRIRHILQQMGLIVVMWDRDTEDWRLNDGTTSHDKIMNLFNSWLPPPGKSTNWFSRFLGRGQNRNRKARGLILEHDLTMRNVRTAIAIQSLLAKQSTVAECIGEDQLYL